ncbi:MAG TPA: zf-HC2 domain-containing protein [Blastocatellia bacterium]|nr:zf-HC2 domain-containing protein [Blastocatellia bacterium]
MNCELFVQRASEFLDGQLKLEQRQLVSEHVELCAKCHEHLEELRSVSLLLGGLPAPKPAENLQLEILAATEQRESVPWNVRTMFSYKMTPFKPRPLANISGLVLSVVCFVFILSQFTTWPFWKTSLDIEGPVYISHADFDKLNPIGVDFHGDGPFTLPRVSDMRTLDYVNSELEETGRGDEIIFLARVAPDGRVTWVQMLRPDNDPKLRDYLIDMVGRTRFVPAHDGERPVESQAVLMMYWVNVKG